MRSREQQSAIDRIYVIDIGRVDDIGRIDIGRINECRSARYPMVSRVASVRARSGLSKIYYLTEFKTMQERNL